MRSKIKKILRQEFYLELGSHGLLRAYITKL